MEKSNANDKFKSNSVILNEILENQISSKDKSGLGYNKKGKELEEDRLTSNDKCEMGSTSTSRKNFKPRTDLKLIQEGKIKNNGTRT